nr:hypothetical protein [Candidatus Sigynarchaeum springense]
MVSVAFTPDGRTITASDRKRNVYAWDAATGTLRWRAAGGTPWRYSYTKPKSRPRPDLGVEIIDVKGWSAHGAGHVFVAASPDGRTITSGGHDGVVRAWDVATGKLLSETWLGAASRKLIHSGGLHKDMPIEEDNEAFDVASLVFSPDGRWLALGRPGYYEFGLVDAGAVGKPRALLTLSGCAKATGSRLVLGRPPRQGVQDHVIANRSPGKT